MDGSNRGLGWFCIRHAGIQLWPLRGAEKRDRLGLSGVEPQGCCVCELRKRHGCAVRQYSKDMALMLQWFERVGYSADIAGLEREFGRALTKLPDWARRHARPNERWNERTHGRPTNSMF